MAKRLDLSDFEPRPYQPSPGAEAHELVTSIESIGNTLWDDGPRYGPEENERQLARLPELGEALRQQVGLPNKKAAPVALVDWTSLDNTCRLMSGGFIIDPFVAILDFSAVVCAAIFYDYIIVLDDKGTSDKANELLGLDNVIRSIDPHTLDDADERMQKLLNAHFVSAVSELERATLNPNPHAPWIEWLKNSWRALLPDMNFPDHVWSNYDTRLGYTASPDRKSGCKIIFEHEAGAYRTIRRREDTSKMILDNDLRALFYEYLARTFSWVLGEDKGGPRVRYIGGCLRTPMLVTRANLAEAKLEPENRVENWVQSVWQKLPADRSYPIRLPFWMDAVLAGSESPAGVARSVAELRRAAGKFRKSKSTLEAGLAAGDSETTEKLIAMLQGDAEQLTGQMSQIAGVSLDIAAVSGKAVLPVVPWDTLKKVPQAVGKNWFQQIGLRVFRPQFWFLYSMGRRSLRLRKSVPKAFKVFSLERDIVASQPLEFLEHFGEVSWSA